MQRHLWSDLATDALLDELGQAAGLPSGAALELRPRLARVLATVGGLRLAAEPLPPERCTEIGRALLHEAMNHLLAKVSKPPHSGFRRERNGPAALQRTIVAMDRVPINTVGADEAQRTLGLARGVAEELVRERSMRGPYAGLDELERRVRGIGPVLRAELADGVRFDGAVERLTALRIDGGDFRACLGALLAANEGTPLHRLGAVLDMLAAEGSAAPHPATRLGLQRQRPAPPPAPELPAEWLGLLHGEDYPRVLPRLFAGAAARIDVCMFHIAMPGDDHPTRALLEALVAAHRRGVAVRVLVDRDRPSDAYHSTVINSRARTFLREGGLDCRWDPANKLLHSKFVVIDDALVVLGSHNWSEGSYQEFEDLSFAVSSAELAASLRRRYDELWVKATA